MAPIVKVSVVIPAYNEARRIAATIHDAQSYFESRNLAYEIVVSAEGTDGTREVAAALGRNNPAITVIGSPARRGKGRGIRETIRLTTGDIVGFVDADHKTPMRAFDDFAVLLQQGYDLVIGSRGLPGAVIERPQPLHRRIGSRGFALFMHAVVGLRDYSDTQCGFKFFRRQIAIDLFSRQRIDGYMFDVEILYLASKAGYRIGQVPVQWRDDGDSRLQLVMGNARNFADILRIRFGACPAAAAPESDRVRSGEVAP
jgi:dolichyl-phosphate beta-glucosyltransferase